MGRRETASFWNKQLNLRELIPDYAAWQDRYEALSAIADRLSEPVRMATGPHPEQALFRIATGPATHRVVFVHGGGWTFYRAENYSFVAETALAARAAFFNVEYRKMPAWRLAELVADTVAALEIASSGAERVVLVGHSAGAHLAVEAALRSASPPAAVVALSGVYDLDPLRYSFVQEAVAFTEEEVAAFSPLRRVGELRCPLHLLVGDDETVEYRRQSVRMFERAEAAAVDATLTFVPRRHHASLVADLAEPHSVASAAVQRFVG